MQAARPDLDDSGEAMLIAPQEVRELITRLTEQSVEGVRFDEPRTLAGLSLETGIPTDQIRQTLRQMHRRGRRKQVLATVLTGVGMAVIGLVALTRMPTQASPIQTPAAPIDGLVQPVSPPAQVVEVQPQSGLVPVTQVTYGPDSGNSLADPTFSPPHPMPTGLSVSLGINNLLWGAGDPRTGALHDPFDKQTEKDLHENIVSLLEYVRTRAGKFGLKPAQASVGDPTMSSEGPSYNAMLQENDYNGVGSQAMSIPLPGKAHDAEANRIFTQAADNFVTQIQDRLHWNRLSRSDMGPQ